MFNAHFFRDVLPAHTAQKAKNSAEGVVTLELHLQFGGRYKVAEIVETADEAVIIEVYPEHGDARRTPREERQLGAPPFELDRIALAYGSISQVVITTERARKDIGFHVRR